MSARQIALALSLLVAPSVAEAGSSAEVHGGSSGADTYSFTGANAASGASSGIVNGVIQAGVGESSASLATGDLRARALGGPISLVSGNLVVSQTTAAEASFGDTIHIVGAVGAMTEGHFTIHVDGSLTSSPFEALPGAPFGQFAATASASFSFSANNPILGALPGGLVQGNANTSGVANSNPALCANATATNLCEIGGNVSFDFILPFDFSDTARTVNFTGALQAIAQAGGAADFSHTASVDIVLPAGLSFTSDSGVFLTQAEVTPPPVGVVEPASLSLLISGVLPLTLARRRKKAA
jgi:hypothetical protein